LNVDDHFGLSQPLAQLFVLALQATALLQDRVVGTRLAAAFLGGQGIQGLLLALSPSSP
jgi:hypothetical protein